MGEQGDAGVGEAGVEEAAFLERRLAQGDEEGVAAALRGAVDRMEAGGIEAADGTVAALRLARLALLVLEPRLALRFLETRLRACPTDARAAEERRRILDEVEAPLAEARERERGGVPRGEAVGSLATVERERVDAAEEQAIGALLSPEPADLARFLYRFEGREDTHARQWADGKKKGGYSPIRGPLTASLLRSHFAGDVTLGVYPVRADGTANFVALDLDIRRAALERAEERPAILPKLRAEAKEAALALRAKIASIGLPVLIEESGFKGWHLWLFLERPQPADLARRLGLAIAKAWGPHSGDLTVEVFPKQARADPGVLGNLIKLPLGIHRVTGRRALFYDPSGAPYADPLAAMRAQATVTREQMLDALDALRGDGPETPPGSEGAGVGVRDRSEPQRGGAGEAAGEASAKRPGGSASQGATPSMSEGELWSDATIGAVLSGCHVVRALAEQALGERRLTHDERVVLAHSLGSLRNGVDAVNLLLRRCPETPESELLQRPLRGQPISCAGIRRRVAWRTRSLPCHCEFPEHADRYPTPGLFAPEGDRLAGSERKGGDVEREPTQTELQATGTDAAAGSIAEGAGPTREADSEARQPAGTAPGARGEGARDGVGETSPDDSEDPTWVALRCALERIPGNRLVTPSGIWALVRRGARGVVVFTPYPRGGC